RPRPLRVLALGTGGSVGAVGVGIGLIGLLGAACATVFLAVAYQVPITPDAFQPPDPPRGGARLPRPVLFFGLLVARALALAALAAAALVVGGALAVAGLALE